MTIHETMLSTFAEICAELAVRGSYTGAAVMSLTEQVCWENLFHEIRDRAEPVYAFDANGLLSAALKYRGRKLFDSNATLLWREPTHSEEDDELDTTRYLEMWLFRKITSAHIERVLEGIADNRTQVRNTKAYLLAALFNSVSTIDHYYTIQYNHDYRSP